MDIEFRDATSSDKEALISLLEDLQDHMIPLDSLKRTRRMPEYGSHTYADMRNYLKEYEGKCIVAQIEGEIVGFIAGLIAKQPAENLLSVIPHRLGVIKELYVKEKFRKLGVGHQLMQKIEEYFLHAKCDCVWIEVFAPNENAHSFYKQHGYQDREINMIKKI